MSSPRFSLACWDYDRVRPLMDGHVRVDGADLNFLALTPEETFFRAFRNAEFEITELSLSTTLMTMSRGECPYTPIPVFPSRSFRHSGIYVRAGSGIKTPEDLKGRRVATPEYQVTAAMVARGILQDEYGVHPSDVEWIQAGLTSTNRIDKVNFIPPSGVTIEKIRDRTIPELFERGEIDALVSPRAPKGFDPSGDGSVQRLFTDPNAEADYFKKTGIFPIMHLIGVRNDVLAANPWLPSSLMKAFTKAKDIALNELAEATALKIAMPFLPAQVTALHQTFGPDFWPYGVEANRATLEASVRWSFEQGLSARQMTVEELFAPQSLASFQV
ncbi:ABC transporter substrate-binding protein [Paraburkholderia sp. CNPSo 3155]|uniref:ABC transporter substrate-binding protein n=1 Tax=Paraburkholderia atlantica TaxID=2654982 RepID=UPI00128B3333|nr:ABC transporter substrate-binding protein [Paraburkholderia atlantica]MPW06108.1 ABC transporter substrate-binding protein [Paraburkholderia atlantica]